jgi:small subunit ribosomal protein S21
MRAPVLDVERIGAAYRSRMAGVGFWAVSGLDPQTSPCYGRARSAVTSLLRRVLFLSIPCVRPVGRTMPEPAIELETDGLMQIIVRDNNVDQALRALKKKLQREGVYREMKLRRHYEKPSEKRAREKAAAIRRARKLERKRVERDGAR